MHQDPYDQHTEGDDEGMDDAIRELGELDEDTLAEHINMLKANKDQMKMNYK